MNIKLAGCIIKDDEGKILLLHRNTPKRVQWEIPGGKIDEGENPEQAATREVKEELGVDVVIQESLGKREFSEDNFTMHYTWCLAAIVKGTPRILEPETFDQLRYFSEVDLQQLYDELSPNTRNFIEYTKQ